MTSSLRRFLLRVPAILIIGSGFSPEGNTFLSSVQQETLDGILALDAAMNDLEESLISSEEEEIRRRFHKAREVYKRHEFILEYFHHSSINKKINGAPLPKIEEKVADLNILSPQGFQRMEELIYESPIDQVEMKKLIKSFRQELEPIRLYQERIRLYDRHILEAIRYELLRIYTLGLTGFENPASSATLDECFVAFLSLEKPSLHYASLAGKTHEEKVARLFSHGKDMIKDGDFDSFDRLTFLKKVSDPLFASLYEVHVALGIETHEEVNTAPIATNYTASSLFDINLLNKDFFLKYETASLTDTQKELGKVLFYDPALSFNNSLSCSSCHQPSKAFTDGKAKSVSNNPDESLSRNAPTLLNSLFAGAYFHDLRAGKLDMQTEHVMVNPKEFNVRPLELAEKLRLSKEYAALFQEAYPGIQAPIQPRTIKRSLAAYVASLVSWNSPFDQYVRGESDELSASAKRGYNLFMGKAACGTCHFAPNFSGIVPPFYDDTESEVLGIPSTNDTINPVLDSDEGRYRNGIRAEHAEHFLHSFKTPTIRNIELTGPYFHNGAYPTLEEVMWFYNKGGGVGIGLDVPNQTLPPDPLDLKQQEIDDIIAFMKSLTDIEQFQDAPPVLPNFENIKELKNRS